MGMLYKIIQCRCGGAYNGYVRLDGEPNPGPLRFPGHVVSFVIYFGRVADSKDAADAETGLTFERVCSRLNEDNIRTYKKPTPKMAPSANFCCLRILSFQNRIVGMKHAIKSCNTLITAAAIMFVASSKQEYLPSFSASQTRSAWFQNALIGRHPTKRLTVNVM